MNINDFKKAIAPFLLSSGYKLHYHFFPESDFGSLDRVEIEGCNKIGTVDLWSKGWMSIDIYDLKLEVQSINILLEPSQIEEKNEAIKSLQMILNANE